MNEQSQIHNTPPLAQVYNKKNFWKQLGQVICIHKINLNLNQATR